MSKLFNTLEKIRSNEAGRPREVSGNSRQGARLSKKTLGIAAALLGALLALGLLYFIRTPAGLMPRLNPLVNKLTGPAQSFPDNALAKKQIPIARPSAGQTAPTGETEATAYLSSAATLQKMQEELARAADLPAAAKAALLNNIGAYHIHNREYWKGLYFLEQAMTEAPDAVESFINYAVALTEMGLYGVAGNYLEMAYQLDPGHPALLQNTALLKQSHIMDETLNSLYSQ